MKRIGDILREKLGNKEYKEAADMARAYAESKGVVKLPIGSYWLFIHADWLAKGLEEGVLHENAYGQFVPVCIVRKEQHAVKKRGKVVEYEDREKLDYSAFFDFADRYEKFCQQQKHVDEEMEGLVHQ